jgi:cytochrome c-type biogenesis protein CcmH/NrfG
MERSSRGRIPQGVPVHTLPALVIVSRSEFSPFSVAPSAVAFGHAGALCPGSPGSALEAFGTKVPEASVSSAGRAKLFRVSDKITTLRMLAEAEPGDATTWFLLGRELAAQSPSEAAEAFRRAIGADPDYSAAYRQLGNALEAAGLVDEAVAAYTQGIEVAERTHDLQAGKEMNAFLKRIARGR